MSKNTKGAKGNESAINEGLIRKETTKVKNMYSPHEKSQRMKKGSDRA
ncbi:hypothetical protein [Hahella ganghwensis]|nr:hypothetical protein [Hahella ganghwensis]